jgi:hypothetical protein
MAPVSTAELLITAVANVEARDSEGCTPLMLAALRGYLAAVEI